jgi:hypothetical protein
MKGTAKKLQVRVETIRALALADLTAAVGGRTFSVRPDITCEPPTISSPCPTDGCGSGGSANTCDTCTLTAF